MEDKEMINIVAYAILCALAVFGFPGRAEAYLDPTTGSMALQVIMGGVLAASLAMKVYWKRFASLFRRRKPEDSQ
jgi:hypothetical protein